MRDILIIAKKEIIDLLRDRRALITMIIIPLLLFPLIMTITTKISSDQVKKEQEQTIKLGVAGEENAPGLMSIISGMDDFEITGYSNPEEFDTLIRQGTLNGAMVISYDFDEKIDSMKQGIIRLFYKSENWGTQNRMHGIVDQYKAQVVNQRLASMNVSAEVINPVNVQVTDISTEREKIGNAIGGFLPYILIIFGFIGCMYPAIDLFTNEKERGTIETILVTPVSRLSILFGKMSVVSLTGLISALLSIIGISFGMTQFADNLPDDIMGALGSFIEPLNIIMLIVMLIPLIIFFAGILTLITTYAQSYKEAQTIISPMMFVIIVPAVIGLLPGVELNFSTAFIPITNISLASKAIIAGTIQYGHFVIVMGSLILFAVLGVFAAVKWFSRETNVIKT
ncbi:MAG: ABC transporter permease [Bacteroidota bacterium]